MGDSRGSVLLLLWPQIQLTLKCFQVVRIHLTTILHEVAIGLKKLSFNGSQPDL